MRSSINRFSLQLKRFYGTDTVSDETVAKLNTIEISGGIIQIHQIPSRIPSHQEKKQVELRKLQSPLTLDKIQLMKKLRTEDPLKYTQSVLSKQFGVPPIYIAKYAPSPTWKWEQHKEMLKQRSMRTEENIKNRKERLYAWIKKQREREQEAWKNTLLQREKQKKTPIIKQRFGIQMEKFSLAYKILQAQKQMEIDKQNSEYQGKPA